MENFGSIWTKTQPNVRKIHLSRLLASGVSWGGCACYYYYTCFLVTHRLTQKISQRLYTASEPKGLRKDDMHIEKWSIFLLTFFFFGISLWFFTHLIQRMFHQLGIILFKLFILKVFYNRHLHLLAGLDIFWKSSLYTTCLEKCQC